MLNRIKRWFLMEGIRYALKEAGNADLMAKSIKYISEVDVIDIKVLKELLTALLDDWKEEIKNV